MKWQSANAASRCARRSDSRQAIRARRVASNATRRILHANADAFPEAESTAFALSSGTEVGVTVSIGVAHYEGRPDYQPLLAAADDALYRAKEGGRNRVEAALG